MSAVIHTQFLDVFSTSDWVAAAHNCSLTFAEVRSTSPRQTPFFVGNQNNKSCPVTFYGLTTGQHHPPCSEKVDTSGGQVNTRRVQTYGRGSSEPQMKRLCLPEAEQTKACDPQHPNTTTQTEGWIRHREAQSVLRVLAILTTITSWSEGQHEPLVFEGSHHPSL